MTAVSAPTPVELDQPEVEDVTFLDRPWVTIVWNDPVNLMDYVTFVFQTYFGYSKAKAEKLMMQVHKEGKSVVSNGNREAMRSEEHTSELQSHVNLVCRLLLEKKK